MIFFGLEKNKIACKGIMLMFASFNQRVKILETFLKSNEKLYSTISACKTKIR